MASQFQKDQDYFYNQNLGTTNKLIKDRQTANTNMTNQYIADQNAIVDKSVANAVDKVNTQISGLPTQYQSAFDANAIQQKINERQTAEHMANMGLTDSGLNRTQQTAFAVQRSNADAALRQQMNAATVSLKQQIADLYVSGETQKMQTAADAKYQLAQTNQSVYNTYMDNLNSRAYAYAENEANNRAAIEKERIKAEADKPKLTEELFDEAYELYDPNNDKAFYDYIDKLEVLGYGEDVLAELVAYVISKKGVSVQRAWQGPIYQPNAAKQNETKSTKTTTTTKNPATTWKGWSGLW